MYGLGKKILPGIFRYLYDLVAFVMAFWPLFFHVKPIFHKLYYIVVYSLSFSFALFVSIAEIEFMIF